MNLGCSFCFSVRNFRTFTIPIKHIAKTLISQGRCPASCPGRSEDTLGAQGFCHTSAHLHLFQMVGVGTEDLDLNKYKHKFCSLIGRDGDGWGLSYTGEVQHKGQRLAFSTKGVFGQGTIIGLHLDMWKGTLAFYKNRKPLGRKHLSWAMRKCVLWHMRTTKAQISLCIRAV